MILAAVHRRRRLDPVRADAGAGGRGLRSASRRPTARAGLSRVRRREARPRPARPALARHQGFEVCRTLRTRSTSPIIIVTAQTDTHDLVAGLEAGADDYVTKPVMPKELAARIRAPCAASSSRDALAAPASRFGDVELRREQGIVLKHGEELDLTKTEFRLLCEFADHPGMVLSRDQLLERVWGYEYLGDSRLVDAHVRRLRLKIEDHPDDPRLIVTVRGLGYRLLERACPLGPRVSSRVRGGTMWPGGSRAPMAHGSSSASRTEPPTRRRHRWPGRRR